MKRKTKTRGGDTSRRDDPDARRARDDAVVAVDVDIVDRPVVRVAARR